MAGASKGTTKQPVKGSFMPKATQSYSDWIVQHLDEHLAQENPEQGLKHTHDGKNIMWPVFADWARNNVKRLKDTIYVFMQDQKSWIFDFFPIKLSKATRFIQQNFDINQVLPTIGVRKVPFPNISMTVHSREKHSVYTTQGFSMDYHFMKTEEGMEVWNRFVDAITANLWSFVIYNSLNEMNFEPSYYRKMNQMYPFDSVPRDLNELFEWEKKKMFILNKNPQGFHVIQSDADRVMGQKSIKCKGLVVARDDMWFAHGRNPDDCFYDKAGPISLRARSTAGQEKNIDGATLYPIPLGAGNVHDTTFERILQNTIQNGSFVRFPELTQNVPASEYVSSRRSIRFSSVTRNGPTKYTLYEALCHSPEFVPLDNSLKGTDRIAYTDDDDDCMSDNDSENDSVSSTDNDDNDIAAQEKERRRTALLATRRRNPAGKLNRSLLYRLIDNRENIFKNNLRTALERNMERVNQFVRYNKSGRRGQELYPISVFGELAECNVRTKYLAHVNRTMEYSMFMGIDKAGINKFEKGLRLARDLNATSSVAHIAAMSKLIDTSKVVRATARFENRSGGKTSIEDYLGCDMLAPTPQGGVPLDTTKLVAASAAGGIRPYGFGNVAGFMTLLALEDNNTTNKPYFNEDDIETIRQFMYVYKQVVGNMRLCCRDNPALSPSLIPLHHNSPDMDNNTRILIAVWYSIFSHFITPNIIGTPAAFATAATATATATLDIAQEFAGLKLIMDTARNNAFAKVEAYRDANLTADQIKGEAAVALMTATRADFETIRNVHGVESDRIFTAKTTDERKRASALRVYKSVVDYFEKRIKLTEARIDALKETDVRGGGLDVQKPRPAAIPPLEAKDVTIDIAVPADDVRARAADFTAFASNRVSSNTSRALPDVAAGVYITQFTFENLPKGADLSRPGLHCVPSDSAPLGCRHVVQASAATSSHFEDADKQMFSGSLFTALPFVHPQLPLVERSGNISDSLRKRPELGRINVPGGRTARFRSDDWVRHMGKYDSKVYTKEFFEELSNHELLLQYPEFVAHIIANPLVRFNDSEVSDFEARYIGTFAMQASVAAAARCLLFTPITLQSIGTMFDNNIALPLGAKLIRPFEEQTAFSGFAIAGGDGEGEAIGTTYFSGFDNMVNFDALSQHFTVQAFLWMSAVVTDTKKFLPIPMIRAGAFSGGKGHLFVNQNATQPMQQLENVINSVSGCAAETLGANSIIAVSDTYNDAIEESDIHHFDVRNNYRKEDFAGRIEYAPSDFLEQRQDLAYAGAPILNQLFDWDYDRGVPLQNQNFAQMMAGRGKNFVVHEALAEVWDGKPNGGWRPTISYHPWDKTDTYGCLDVQQSHASVVQAVY